MREIKFRAWDDGEMYVGVGLDPNTISYTIPKGVRGFDNFVYHPEAVLMQYTGLKDKNGVEIYEGDLLTDADGRIGSVLWSMAGWYYQNMNGTYGLWAVVDNFIGGRQLCVVGNIYENPDLFKEEA